MKRFSNRVWVADSRTDDTAAFRQAVTLANNNQAPFTVVGLVEASDREKAASDLPMTPLLDAMVEQRRDELQTLVNNASPAPKGGSLHRCSGWLPC